MIIKKRLLILFILIFLSLFSFSNACKFMPREYSDIYASSDYVFIGKQVLLKDNKNNSKSIKNIENLKGQLPKEIEVIDKMTGTSCERGNYSNKSFSIISVKEDDGKFYISEINMDKSFETVDEAKIFFSNSMEKIHEDNKGMDNKINDVSNEKFVIKDVLKDVIKFLLIFGIIFILYKIFIFIINKKRY